MKIKTITCHDVNNYGASLQAYALQTYLQKLGHDVEIIDYLPTYKVDRLNFFGYNRMTGKLYHIAKIFIFLKPIIGLYDHLKTRKGRACLMFYKKRKPFKQFKKYFLNCTSYVYHDINDLKRNVPQADLYIAGSDQIWNSVSLNGRDPSFYCAFTTNNTPCISYAASFGTSYIPKEMQKFVSDQLKSFRSISVREKSGIKIINELGYNATEVLDPVFLLNKEEWNNLCNNHHNEKYVLVYDLDMNHPGIKRLSKEIAEKNNWKIYSLNDFNICPYADLNINNAGPIEFIEWIRDAQFVICSSFHGSAFSVIFQKQFYTFPLYKGNNHARMVDFLTKLSIADHYIKEYIDVNSINKIDYQKVQKQLNEYIEKSKFWLRSNII